MYSWEINNFISSKHNTLTSNEYIEISDISKNPQISRIKYDPFKNEFNIWTDDNYHWTISVNN